MTQKHCDLIQDHLDGISTRNLKRRYDHGRDTSLRMINNTLRNFKTCHEVTNELVDCTYYAGILVVDGKFVPCKEEIQKTEEGILPRSKKRQKIAHGMVWVPYIDYHTHDIPVFISARSENVTDLRRGFRYLKEVNYPLLSVTADKSPRLLSALYEEYPGVFVQYCIKHYLSEIQRKLNILGFRRTQKRLQTKMTELNYDGYAHVRNKSRRMLIRLINRLLALEYQYEILNDFYETMAGMLCAKTIEQRDSKRRYLENIFFKTYFPLEASQKYKTRIMKVYQQFLCDEPYLFTSLEHPELDIPRTTNLNEGYNNQLENRIFSIRGFETIETCHNYGNALILQRRFKTFTDCKGKFKHLNGKSPLELAGADTNVITSWIRFSMKKG